MTQRNGNDPLLALLNGDGNGVEPPRGASLTETEPGPVAVAPANARDPDLLTPEQAAKVLAVSVRTLSRLTASGDVPHLRLGERLVRYSRAALAEWIERNMRR